MLTIQVSMRGARVGGMNLSGREMNLSGREMVLFI